MRVWLLVLALAGCGAPDDHADGPVADLSAVAVDLSGEDSSVPDEDGGGDVDGMGATVSELGVLCVPSGRQCTSVESCCPVVGCVAVDGGDCP